MASRKQALLNIYSLNICKNRETFLSIKKRIDPFFLSLVKIFPKISRIDIVNVINYLTQFVPKMPNNNKAFSISHDTEVGQIMILLLAKYNKDCYVRISDLKDIVNYEIDLLPHTFNKKVFYLLNNRISEEIDRSKFIPLQEVYSYCSAHSINIYFSKYSIMMVTKYIFDTPETTENRSGRRAYLRLLHERLPEHSIIGDLNLVRNIILFI